MTGSSTTPLVSVHSEWDPLEEVILGRATNARVPRHDPLARGFFFQDGAPDDDAAPGPFPERVIAEADEDLELFAETLERLGIRVRRPDPSVLDAAFETPDWRSDGGFYTYSPRDSILIVGETILEPPMPMRSRYYENLAYRETFAEAMRRGARWIAAPKPRLTDASYDLSDDAPGLTEAEPLFDAANVLRCGVDLLYLVSRSGNELGRRWLETVLGPPYRVHPMRGLYANMHVDSTIALLRPGLALVNPARVDADSLPEALAGWQLLRAPEPVDVGHHDGYCASSPWVNVNVLSLSPERVVVEARQTETIRLLEKHGFEVVPVRFRHARTLGGGPHCVTVGLRRRGRLEDYVR